MWIATPYFVPDEQFLSALKIAALRGCDVRIIVPDSNDNQLVHFATWALIDRLKGTGVQFYRYEAAFMHQKVMLIDDHIATVGTANFDNRSFRLNFEINIAVDDEEFAGKVAAMLESDLSHSRAVGPEELDNSQLLAAIGYAQCAPDRAHTLEFVLGASLLSVVGLE